MITDLDRDIVTIKYNILNLPELIQFRNGCQIRNKYDASGRKLEARNVTLASGVYNPLNPGQVIEDLDVNELDLVTINGTAYIGNMEYTISRYFDWDVSYAPKNVFTLNRVHNPEGYTTYANLKLNKTGPIYHYYRRDHLGNNREVWQAEHLFNSKPKLASTIQRTQYYPSGLPWKSSTADGAALQPYKYGGKEFIETHGLDEYYSYARNVYPAIMRTTTLDPHAESYYSVSPYAWCGNNPVNRVDLDGRDIWEINSQGEIINRIKDKTQDAFYLVDNKGDRVYTTDAGGNNHYNSISFKYGTVESQRTTALNSTDSYDTYKIRGDANGTQIFEFMSQNTTVEWSQAKTGVAGDKGLNFVTTSHDAATERGMKQLYIGQLYNGYTIREMNHNHPGNTAYPSGSFDYTDREGNFHPIGTWGDIGFSRGITNNRQANRLNVPIFQIYLPGSKSYISFGPNSIRSDY